MKKLLTLLLAGILLLAVTACSNSAKETAESSVSVLPENQDTLIADKANGELTEEEVIDLVAKQAIKDAEKEDLVADETSGQVLDENDTAYLIAFDISDSVSNNYMYMEAYWFNKKTRQIKDVCSLNEYYDGLIDLTKGESRF